MLFEELLIYITIPLTAIFIRLSLEKLKVVEKWLSSRFTVLNNLGYCAFCYYTWSNLFVALIYAILVKDFGFLLYSPAFTVISLMFHFKFFEDEQ